MLNNFFKKKNKLNSQNIFLYDSKKENIDVSSVFEIRAELNNLRVKNQNINCLFKQLDLQSFDLAYNKFFKHLNLDFSDIEIETVKYQLPKNKQEALVQTIITNWIYYYTINELDIEVNESDFKHPFMVDYVLSVFEKKYGIDTNVSLKLGARILREELECYISKVKGRRRYYEK